MNIEQAGTEDVEGVARLFDLYRQFYSCAPDPDTARRFIGDRLAWGESTIFVARNDDGIVGFVQLYTSFCSVDAIKIMILYDLFVDPDVRGSGIGEALMNRATGFARAEGAGRLDLLTDKDNLRAQGLYEKLGYARTLEDFYAYSLTV